MWVQLDAPFIENSTAILGTVRPERSDEFVVSTTLAFSQAYTGYAPINDIAQAWPTNMLTVYNQPVLDPTIISKPFFWGYLLFGSAKGLAWYWCGRLIALFLVTFEMFMLLTRGKKIWAVTAAFMVAFSSVIQWWFAVNFFVEMLVFGQLAIIVTWHFLRSDTVLKKLVCAIVFALCGGAYAFALYPPWQIPLLYLFAVLFIWAVVVGIKENRASGRSFGKNWIYVCIAVIIAAGLIGYWYIGNKEAIDIIQNTAYPGRRQEFGGGMFVNLFNYIVSVKIPYMHYGSYSGGGLFPSFFPVGEALAIICLIKTKLKDKLLLALLAINLLLILYTAVGLPPMLAKATLLSNSHPWAIAIISSLVSVFILIRVFSDLPNIFTKLTEHNVWLNRFVPIALIVVALISGASVNPLMRGISAVTEKPVFKVIQQLQEEDGGIWIGSWPTGDYMIAAGAPTINSTNIIPALERWEMFDPEHDYIDVYNRFVHIYIGFNTEKTTFGKELDGGGIIGIDLAMNDLKKLDVKYILINDANEIKQTLPTERWDNGHAEKIYEEYGLRIYKIFYD